MNRLGRSPYGCTQLQELIVADQKQSRVSFGLSISVMNAAAMRPTAAILKGNHLCRPAVGPTSKFCNIELDDIVSTDGVHVTTMLADGR
jgi:hypothetical protein